MRGRVQRQGGSGRVPDVLVRQPQYAIQRAHHLCQVPAVRFEPPRGADVGGRGGVLTRGDPDDEQTPAAQRVGEVADARGARGEELRREVQSAAGQQVRDPLRGPGRVRDHVHGDGGRAAVVEREGEADPAVAGQVGGGAGAQGALDAGQQTDAPGSVAVLSFPQLCPPLSR